MDLIPDKEVDYITLPTLYKLNTNCKVMRWKIHIDLNGGNTVIKKEYINKKLDPKWFASIVTEWGLNEKGSKIQKAIVDIKKGKNIGKKNETNVLEQALSEMLSIWKAQQEKKNYVQEIKETKTEVIKPMLLHKYADNIHKLDFENDIYIQPKLDGVRMMTMWNGNKIEFTSRTGKLFYYLDHIRTPLENNNYLKKNKNIYLDGELFSRETDFEKIVSICKKSINLSKSQMDEQKLVKYYVYDLYNGNEPKMPFVERYKLLKTIVKNINSNNIVIVPTFKVDSNETVLSNHRDFVNNNYEGSVIRVGNSIYSVGKRSYGALKLKDFETDEFKITGFEDGKGKEKGLIKFILETKKGKTFNARPALDSDIRAKMFKEGKKYIGKMATIQFFGYTKYDVPRHPVFIAIRDYE